MAEGHQEPPGTGELRTPGSLPNAWVPPVPPGLVPPSHFMLRPSRTLEAELAAERRRSQALEAELEAERGRSQALGVELKALRGRSQALEAELEAERGRSQALEAELVAEWGRSPALGVELQALRGRVQAQGAEPVAGQPLGQVLLRAQLSALSHILTLQEQELDLEVSPPGPCPPRLGTLLGRWRQKVFVLLVQLQVQEEALRSLRGQVGALGTAVAAGTRRVTRLELQLHEREKLRGDRQRLEREVTRQRGRAEAALGALGALVRAASRLAGAVTALEAQVTKATRSLGTMSGRLSRAGQRLRDLRGLVAPAVASEQPRWPQDPAGDNPVTQVTKPVAGGRRGAVAPGVTHEQVTRDAVALGTLRWGDGVTVSPLVSPPVALAALVTQLQALGAAILGDTSDTSDPP